MEMEDKMKKWKDIIIKDNKKEMEKLKDTIIK
jgi:hypothetical protein